MKLHAGSKDTKPQGNGTKNFITSLSEYRSIRDAVKDKHFPLQIFLDFTTAVCHYAKGKNLIPELRDQTKFKPTKMSMDHTCVDIFGLETSILLKEIIYRLRGEILCKVFNTHPQILFLSLSYNLPLHNCLYQATWTRQN